jgi:hypothetical protein
VPTGKLQHLQLKLFTEIKTTRKQDPNSKMTTISDSKEDISSDKRA